MSVMGGWLAPHPPLIFPEVGRGKQNEITATIAAFKSASMEIAAMTPETIVIISPHSVIYADYFHISPGDGAEGDMRSFGVSGVKTPVSYDSEFVEALSRICEEEGFPAGTLGERDRALDHGTSIPARFINEAFAANGACLPKYVRSGVAGLTFADHYRFGKLIAETANKLSRKIVVIASGDLSHKLLDDGPYGYAHEGPEFDKHICDIAADADFSPLFEMEESFLEKAAECGHRPIIVMAGALDRLSVRPTLYSYEGPFGVGYGLASFIVSGEDDSRAFLDNYLNRCKEDAVARTQVESPHVALARLTVENYVKTGRLYKNRELLPDSLTSGRAGVFVSIKKHGKLRGCIGTISPTTDSVGEEIRANAVSAATRDPRFFAIEEGELPYLEYSVDVLSPAEPIENAEGLDPGRYGVIVSFGEKRGLLLPDLEGIEDTETQIKIAMQKAGIAETDRPQVKLERFEVIRYK